MAGLLKNEKWWQDSEILKPANSKLKTMFGSAMDTIGKFKQFEISGDKDLVKKGIEYYLDKINDIDETLGKDLKSHLSNVITNYNQIEYFRLESLEKVLCSILRYEELSPKPDKSIEVLKKSITENVKYFDSFIKLNEFGNDSYNSFMALVDSGKVTEQAKTSFPSKEDMDLALAFKSIGVDLSYDNGAKLWKWGNETEYKTSKTGIKILGTDNYFKFENNQIQNIISGYFNNPSGRGGKVITPDALFKAYKRLCNEQIQNHPNKSSLEVDIEKQAKAIGTSSEQWKNSQLLDPMMIQSFARKAAIQRIYSDVFKDSKDEQELSKRFDGYKEDDLISLTSPKLGLHSQAYRSLDKLENFAEKFIEKIEKETSIFNAVDYIKMYDDKIKALEDSVRKEYPEAFQEKLQHGQQIPQEVIEKLDMIAELKKAKRDLELNVEFQYAYMQEFVQGNISRITPEQLQNATLAASEYSVSYDENNQIVMPNNSSDNVLQTVITKLPTIMSNKSSQAQQSTASTTEQEVSAISVEEIIAQMKADKISPDLGVEYIANLEQSEVDFLVKAQNLELASLLWANDNLFAKAYEHFKNKQDNATPKGDSSVEAFAASLVEKEGGEYTSIFDENDIILGYHSANPNVRPEKQKEIKDIQDKFNEHLLYLDKATQMMSDNELLEYLDSATSSSRKNEIVAEKIRQAKEYYTHNPNQKNLDMDLAQQRHKNSILGKIARTQCDSLEEGADKEKQIFEKYIEHLSKDQAELDKVLQEKGQTTIDYNNILSKEKQAEKEPQEQKIDKKKFKDLFPSAPSNEEFMKKMKPYCKKYLIKHFIKEILKHIENVEFVIPKKNGAPAKSDYTEEEAEAPADQNPPSTPGSPQTSPTAQGNNIINQITPLELEQLNFVPGAEFFDKLIKKNTPPTTDTNDSQTTDKPQPISDDVKITAELFNILSGKTDISNMSTVVINNRTLGDALRGLANNVLSNKQLTENNSQALMKELQTIKSDYGVVDQTFDSIIVKGFSKLTPVLMAFVFAPCSTVEQEGQGLKMDVGAKYKNGEFGNIAELATMAERREAIKAILEKSNIFENLIDLGILQDAVEMQDFVRGKENSSGHEQGKGSNNDQYTALSNYVNYLKNGIQAESGSMPIDRDITKTDKYRELFNKWKNIARFTDKEAHIAALQGAEKYYREQLENAENPASKPVEAEVSAEDKPPVIEEHAPDTPPVSQAVENTSTPKPPNENLDSEVKPIEGGQSSSESFVFDNELIIKTNIFKQILDELDIAEHGGDEKTLVNIALERAKDYLKIHPEEYSAAVEERQTTKVALQEESRPIAPENKNIIVDESVETQTEAPVESAESVETQTEAPVESAESVEKTTQTLTAEPKRLSPEERRAELVEKYKHSALEEGYIEKLLIEEDPEYLTTMKALSVQLEENVKNNVSVDEANSKYRKGVYAAKLKAIRINAPQDVGEFIDKNADRLSDVAVLNGVPKEVLLWLKASGLDEYLLGKQQSTSETHDKLSPTNPESAVSNKGQNPNNPSFWNRAKTAGTSAVSSFANLFRKKEQPEVVSKQEPKQTDHNPENLYEFQSRLGNDFKDISPDEQRKRILKYLQLGCSEAYDFYIATIKDMPKDIKTHIDQQNDEVKKWLKMTGLRDELYNLKYNEQQLKSVLASLGLENGNRVIVEETTTPEATNPQVQETSESGKGIPQNLAKFEDMVRQDPDFGQKFAELMNKKQFPDLESDKQDEVLKLKINYLKKVSPKSLEFLRSVMDGQQLIWKNFKNEDANATQWLLASGLAMHIDKLKQLNNLSEKQPVNEGEEMVDQGM